MPVFEYFRRQARTLGDVQRRDDRVQRDVVPAALEAYDFSGIDTLVDVAGGHGQVLTSILQKLSRDARRPLRSRSRDRRREAAIRQSGSKTAVSTETGDFFKAVPAGGDAYIMKHIIHDWDDERAITILANIRKRDEAGRPRDPARVGACSPANEPDFGKLIDLEMLLHARRTGADEAGVPRAVRARGFDADADRADEIAASVIEAR